MNKFVGGLRWGKNFWCSWHATYPLARLKVENNKCIFTWTLFFLKKTSYELPIPDIEYIVKKSSLFGEGIQFVHKNATAPKYLLFWTYTPQKICDFLTSQHNVQLVK